MPGKISAGSPKPAGQAVDLAQLFGAVTRNLANNRQTLNKADTANRNHGDNMVAIFQAVTNVMEQNKGAAPSAQLLQASKAVASNKNGSAQLYAGGLAQAAKQFQGQKQVTPQSALPLLQALMGGGQAPTASQSDTTANLLGALLGGGQTTQSQSGAGDLLGALLGGGQTQSQQESGAGDLLGALLGGGQAQSQQQGGAGNLLGALLGGGQGTASTSQGPAGAELLSALMGSTDAQGQHQVDTAKLLSAGLNVGMAYLTAKQQGSSNGQALIGALLKSSPMGQSSHRSQSGAIVADTVLSVLGAMSQRK